MERGLEPRRAGGGGAERGVTRRGRVRRSGGLRHARRTPLKSAVRRSAFWPEQMRGEERGGECEEDEKRGKQRLLLRTHTLLLLLQLLLLPPRQRIRNQQTIYTAQQTL